MYVVQDSHLFTVPTQSLGRESKSSIKCGTYNFSSRKLYGIGILTDEHYIFPSLYPCELLQAVLRQLMRTGCFGDETHC